VFIPEIERCDSAFREKLDRAAGGRGAFPGLSEARFSPAQAFLGLEHPPRGTGTSADHLRHAVS